MPYYLSPLSVTMDKSFMETEGYTFIRTLGREAFGQVVKAQAYRLKKPVAVKIIGNGCNPRILSREKEIPRSLTHPNIIRTYDILTSRNGTVYVVMELCPNGDSKGTLEEGLSCRLFKQLCLAIQYLHGINIAHGDIKCHNLLLDTHYNLKLCDFSISKRLAYTNGKLVLSSDFCGTPNYEAPEILKHRPYNPKLSDVWNMGIVLYEMLFGSLPFKNRNREEFVRLQMKRRITFPTTSSVSTQAKELIHSILQPVPENRITVNGLLESPWLLQGTMGEIDEAGPSGTKTTTKSSQKTQLDNKLQKASKSCSTAQPGPSAAK